MINPYRECIWWPFVKNGQKSQGYKVIVCFTLRIIPLSGTWTQAAQMWFYSFWHIFGKNFTQFLAHCQKSNFFLKTPSKVHHLGFLNLSLTSLLQTVVVVSIESPKPRILERKGHVLKSQKWCFANNQAYVELLTVQPTSVLTNKGTLSNDKSC